MKQKLLPHTWFEVAFSKSKTLVAVALVALAPAAQAQTILGLGTITGTNIRMAPIGAQGLVQINAVNGSALNLAPVLISGTAPGQTLVGIDFRPADNLLYALGYDATTAGNNTQLYTLDAGLNVVTAVGPAIRLELGGVTDRIGFDFNPVADRIRVTSTNGKNYRLNPTTGAFVAMDGDLAYAGGTPTVPKVSAVAYTNSFVGSVATELYDADYRNDLLSVQNPPNSGTLTAPLPLTIAPNFVFTDPTSLGMDIYYNPSTNTNVGYLTEVTVRPNGFSASNTYSLNLSTGLATMLGNTVPASGLFNFEIRDLAVAISPIPTLTWNGSMSSNWRTAANWTPPIVPSIPNNIIIPGGTPNQPVVSQPQQANDVTLLAGALLTTAPGGTLIVGGDFSNNGGAVAGTGDGTVLFNLNVNQTIGGTVPTEFQNLGIGAGTATLNAASLTGPVSVRRLLTLYGDLTVNGQQLTLLSDANGTAEVVNVAGLVNGSVTVQRYIEPSRNAGVGYRHYSAPVSGSTVADLATPGFTPVVNPAFNTIGNTASPFPNVYGYDQARVGSGVPAFSVIDQGYFSPTALSNVLNPTQGYTVNIAPPAKVDFRGTLGNGAISTPALPRSGHPDGGWHLRGNPYPAPLDWQLMINNNRLVNMENALYVFKSSGQYTGSYATYINGVGANGGTNLLPLGQGFYVRTVAGQTGQINFTNNERLTTYANPAFQRGTADARPQLSLSLRGTTAALQTAVYFDAAATAGFDRAADATYLPAANGLLLATGGSSQSLAINGQPMLKGNDVLLPLHVAAATAGTYTLSVDALNNLPIGYHAYLRDAVAGTFTDLASNATIRLTLTPTDPVAGRYALLFTAQGRSTVKAPVELAQLASVYPNPAHHTATLLLPAALRGTQATAVQVLDNLGRVVLTRTLAAGSVELLELPLTTLRPGVYSVQAHTNAGLVAKRLVVE